MQQSDLIQEEKNNDLFSTFLMLMFKGMCFCFKFGIYLIISFLQMIINIIYTLMDFESWDFLNRRNEVREDRLLEVEVQEKESSSKHEYIVKRSNQYNKIHDEIEGLLKVNENQQTVIDNFIADDILAKIDIVVFESEKNALKQGYKFARETKYILEDSEIYESYIKSRVMRGE
ncbi:MAG: hypothetical protein ACI3VR_14875 [Intestinibacter sp.]|uniref:hypothetical protein n=1 Tax=Intestinibacter sp. TaxID=1965304 RepID=UPI003F1376D8